MPETSIQVIPYSETETTTLLSYNIFQIDISPEGSSPLDWKQPVDCGSLTIIDRAIGIEEKFEKAIFST